MESNDALVLIFSRNTFYKRLHILALAAFGVSILVIILLSSILIYLIKNPSKPLYFAADDVGRLIQIVPVNTLNMSQEDVTAWVEEAVEAAYSYDYVNYHSQLQNVEKYFTSYGWSKYMDALSLSGNLRALTTRKQVILAQVIGTPKVRQGMLGGAIGWKYELLLLVTYSMPPYDGSNQFSNALNISVVVQRQKILEGYKGLGIVQLISELASSQTQTNQMQ
jgi:intracellular multiplication protein IcmL